MPTIEAHGELQRAYDFYNRRLFGGRLPPCMIRLERKRRTTYGYFAPERWKSGRAQSDEIAMNPEHFTHARTREVLQTLVHEMTHLWQHHFTAARGAAARGRRPAATTTRSGPAR